MNTTYLVDFANISRYVTVDDCLVHCHNMAVKAAVMPYILILIGMTCIYFRDRWEFLEGIGFGIVALGIFLGMWSL